ncbi:phage-related minor tail protein [Arthrobacter sp. PvP023]|uniref:hypothetical protein n=1 Tax=Micrococcaceae TaxID=1268 RepID=UPI001AE2E12B|nr:hypothetical protein [Arthrobacter sp. PvP023]MBP1134692.1 phage-related minor tail protein [Arthrobacter sp. PvP023]
MDPTTLAGYALMYMAAIAGIVVLLLPILILFLLLLLVTGAIGIVLLAVKTLMVGLIRGITALFSSSRDRHRPRSPGDELVPH